MRRNEIVEFGKFVGSARHESGSNGLAASFELRDVIACNAAYSEKALKFKAQTERAAAEATKVVVTEARHWRSIAAQGRVISQATVNDTNAVIVIDIKEVGPGWNGKDRIARTCDRLVARGP